MENRDVNRIQPYSNGKCRCTPVKKRQSYTSGTGSHTPVEKGNPVFGFKTEIRFSVLETEFRIYFLWFFRRIIAWRREKISEKIDSCIFLVYNNCNYARRARIICSCEFPHRGRQRHYYRYRVGYSCRTSQGPIQEPLGGLFTELL